jgi:hypothetical protein
LGDEGGAPVLDAQGQPRLAVTDANGYYEFAELPPGTYTILEYQPDGYVDGNDTPGSHGGIAINPSLSAEQTESILDVVAIKTVNDAIVFIPIGPGDEAASYNFSEVRVEEDEPPSPPSPPPPYLPPDRPEWPGPLPHLLPVPYASDRIPGTTLYGLAPDMAVFLPLYGGGVMLPPAYTWHLSVLNAGRPRRDIDGGEPAAYLPASLNSSLWAGANLVDGTWTLADGNGQPIRTVLFGLHDGTPVAGDFNGDGVTEIGVYRGGTWYLDLNGNGRWDEHDLWARLGREGDRPELASILGDRGFLRGAASLGAQTQLTGGYVPLSAVAINAEMADAIEAESGRNPSLGHGHTYGGHPLGCAVGVKALEIYQKRDILSHVRRMAPLLQAKIRSFADHPLVGEARGVGLMGALELSPDKAKAAPFKAFGKVGGKMTAELLKHGVILRNMGDVIGICPPMVITEAQIEEMFAPMEKCLDETYAWAKKEGHLA